MKTKKKSPPPKFRDLKVTTAEFETLKALYADDALAPPITVYRWHGPGPRRYFVYHFDGKIQFFNSSSSVQATTEPTPDGVIKWYAKLGYDEAVDIRNEKGDYGTLLHIEITKFLRQKKWNPLESDAIVRSYCKAEKIEVNERDWSSRLWHDMIAFAQFAYDYNLKPLLIEAPLVSFELGVATVLDFVGWIDVKIGKGKNQKVQTLLAIIDWKSPRKASGEHNAMQLRIQDLIFAENFTMTVVDKLFNWSPKDWRKAPDYNLNDKTDAIDASEAKLAMELADFRLRAQPNEIVKPRKVLRLGKESVGSFEVISAEKAIMEGFAEVESKLKKRKRMKS